jgi:hypothetical protein
MPPEQTGYDLYLACGSEHSNASEYLRCLIFLHGIWDGAMTMQQVGGTQQFCPKTTVQVGQMALIFQDWARKHPSDLGHLAAMAAVASFVDAFPCPSTAGSKPAEPIPSGDILVK